MDETVTKHAGGVDFYKLIIATFCTKREPTKESSY